MDSISPSDTLEQAVRKYDRASANVAIQRGEEQREQILREFPISGWPSMPLDRYALGLDDPSTYCRLMEFATTQLGSMAGGSAHKHLIFKRKGADGWYYDVKRYDSVEQAWETVRAGFVRALHLAPTADWEEIDRIDALSGGPALLMKTLSTYYPDLYIQINSEPHLRHYLQKLGHSLKGFAAGQRTKLNRALTAAVQALPEFKGWSLVEIAHFLYAWAHPQDTSGKTISTVKTDTILDLINDLHPDWQGFDDQRFVDAEGYKWNVIRFAQDLLDKEQLSSLLAAGDYDDIIERLDKVGKHKDNNLIFKGVPKSGDLGILYRDELDRPSFCSAIYDLLYGEGETPDRFERYAQYVLQRGLPNKWTFPTMYLFFLYPEDEVFIKPNVIAEYMGLAGKRDLWPSRPGGPGYQVIRDLVYELRDALSDYGPKDMVDVLSVVWEAVTAANKRKKGDAAVRATIAEWVTDERVAERKEGERQARSLLERTCGRMTEEDAREFFRHLNRDLGKGGTVNNRLAPAFTGSQLAQMTSDIVALNRWIRAFWEAPEAGLGAQLDEFWQTNPVPAAGVVLPTALLYLRDPVRYSIMMPSLQVGLSRVAAYTVPKKKSAREYFYYNDIARGLREHHDLEPQVLDIVLSKLTEPPPDKRYWWMQCDPAVMDPDDIEVGAELSLQKVPEGLSAEDEVVLFEGAPSSHVSGFARAVAAGTSQSIFLQKEGVARNRLTIEQLTREPSIAAGPSLADTDGLFVELSAAQFEAIRARADFREDYPIARAMHGLFMPEVSFRRVIDLLESKKNVVLQGAPGVGKTFVAKRLARYLMQQQADDRVEMIQFHQSYSYEDFIQGFRPTRSGSFELVNGVFYTFCRRAEADPDHKYVFIIDEINRGNLSRIFGELMMLIEGDKRGPEYAMPLTYSPGERFHVPENVYVLGLMNTADRSLAMVDYALRRRFAFVNLEPTFNEAFERWMVDRMNAPESLVRRLVERVAHVNKEIAEDTKNLGPGFCIGHSYFCNPNSGVVNDMWYKRIVHYEIEPLLREYWFDDEERARKLVADLLAP